VVEREVEFLESQEPSLDFWRFAAAEKEEVPVVGV
jgi:hypothetical protein